MSEEVTDDERLRAENAALRKAGDALAVWAAKWGDAFQGAEDDLAAWRALTSPAPAESAPLLPEGDR